MCEVANAVVQPRAVMIHFQNAAIAHAAMVSAGRLGCYALLAYRDHLWHQGRLWGFARVSRESHPIMKDYVDEEPMSND